MGIMERISRRSVAIDTQAFIYYIEENKKYFSTVNELFEAIRSKHIVAITSVVTLIEVLNRPIREGRQDLVKEYIRLLSHSLNLRTYRIDDHVAEQAAVFRARYNLRTPDAIQVANAFLRGVKILVCNDAELRRVDEMEILLLDDFVSG